MRPPDPPPPVTNHAYLQRLAALTAPFGVSHTGVAPAAVLERARVQLHQRIDGGLTDGMQFTFKNLTRSTDPQQAVRGAKSIFVAARSYLLPDSAVPSEPSGRVARYAWVDHYAPLREALWQVAHQLRADGYKAVPFADDNSIVDREVAHLAGIGWYGKHANLMVPGAGSWFVLGCVVTTAALPVNDAPVADACGTCTRCLDGCPTGAIIAPGVVDAARCLAWVLQKPGSIPQHLREAVGDRVYGCDECQEVCPPTIRLGHRVPATPPADQVRSWVPLLDLLSPDDDAVLSTWGRWYLADRNPRWVRRNALVALGNSTAAVNGPDRERVRSVLDDYRAHHDPVLREHAQWAARRLGLADTSPTS